MGTRPCRQRAARITAGTLLALQISFIASVRNDSATAESGRAPTSVMIVSRPITAGPAEAHRSTIIGAHALGALKTAGDHVRGLYHRTVHRSGQAAPFLQLRETARTGTAPEQAAPLPLEAAARTRDTAAAGTPPEQAAPLILEAAARTRDTAAAGTPPEQAALPISGTTLQSPRKSPAFQARARTETVAEQAPSTPENAAEAQPSQIRQRQPVRLAQADAKRRLRAAGLTWTSSGKCANRHGRHCTSLQAVRAATVSEAIELKRRSGCPLVVTGGTEVGHAPGPYSHYTGYKLDIKPNACIDRYIMGKHPSQGVRGDGAPLYGESATSGPLYAREADHWDILFR